MTWIALLAAAAVGFWRIRIVGSKADGSDASTLFTAPVPLEEAQEKVVPLVQSTKNEVSLSSSCSIDRSVEMVGTPKVRFTAYFEEEDDCIGCCHVEDEEEEPTVNVVEEFGHREVEVEVSREREEMEVKWEDMVVRRRGDLGWYSFQDMAVLNGSVVRLWDGDSPRRRKSSIAISSF